MAARTRDYWPTLGWRESAPVYQDLNAARLDQARDELTQHYPNIHSLLIVRNGYLVYEHYTNGMGPEMPQNVKSVTKSVLSALVGLAIQTGDINSLKDRLGDFFPDQFTSADDPRKREITVHDLLRMRSGIEWVEWSGCTQHMTASRDWIRFVLDQPLEVPPGERHSYSTGDTQLLSGVLTKATGMSALDFADMYLFGPLGITNRSWASDPQGYTVGGSELTITPRDMAKFGYLYLNEGLWDGDQVIPVAWVRESTAQQSLANAADGTRPEIGYGYLWWLRTQGGYQSAMAVGFGGQFIYVIPDLDLVVVMTAKTNRVPPMFADNRMIREFNVVEDLIIPAVKR
jgi:CubicO group peptidase (beta-lactamase class C family)